MKITFEHLKKHGFVLSKAEAQELHPHMNHISQRGDEVNEVYPGEVDEYFEPSIAGTGDINQKLQGLLDEADTVFAGLIADKDQEIADLNSYVSLLKEQLAAATSDEDMDENTQGPENKSDEQGEDIAGEIKPIKPEHHLVKKKRLKDAGLVEFTVSQSYIDANLDSTSGLKIGDIIEIPA